MFELVADIILAFIIPFYIEIKMAVIMWLVLGTNLIYDTIVDRELKKREKSIDKWLTKVGKLRDELIALVWFEISRCSYKIITSIFSGSLSVLAKDIPAIAAREARMEAADEEQQEDEEDEEEEEERIARGTRRTRRNQASLAEQEAMDIQIVEID